MAMHRIYVPLIDNPSELREAEGKPAGEGRFRLLGRPVAGERWLFNQGEVVECAIQPSQHGSPVLVAVRSCSRDPEYRKRRNTYAVLGAIFGAFLGAAVPTLFEAGAVVIVLGTVFGGIFLAVLSVRWRDAAWRGWQWLESTWWW
jgi:hypothetical protein